MRLLEYWGFTLRLSELKEQKTNTDLPSENDPTSKRYWIGALGTFFSSAIHMNYNLNRAIVVASALQIGEK
jgi:hypothetical protein